MIQYICILQHLAGDFVKIDDMRKFSKGDWPENEEGYRKMMEQLQQMGIDPFNFYQELEMSSRYVNTHRDTSFSKSVVSLHSHNYAEVLFCRTSAGVEYLIGSNRYRLQKGDIVYVPPGTSHRPILPEKLEIPYERDVLWISQEFLENMRQMFPDTITVQQDRNVPIRTAGTRWEFLGELFRAGVLEEEAKRPGWEAAVMGNTLMILANITRIYIERSASPMKAEKPELLDEVTAYIEKYYAERITVSELAHKFYVSDSTLSHLFKQKMGLSIYHYVTQRRLISAKNLISKGISLEQVATQVGFADYSTFYRAFKQEFGISPRIYRNLQENGR